jgi:hypothetical protein
MESTGESLSDFLRRVYVPSRLTMRPESVRQPRTPLWPLARVGGHFRPSPFPGACPAGREF